MFLIFCGDKIVATAPYREAAHYYSLRHNRTLSEAWTETRAHCWVNECPDNTDSPWDKQPPAFQVYQSKKGFAGFWKSGWDVYVRFGRKRTHVHFGLQEKTRMQRMCKAMKKHGFAKIPV